MRLGLRCGRGREPMASYPPLTQPRRRIHVPEQNDPKHGWQALVEMRECYSRLTRMAPGDYSMNPVPLQCRDFGESGEAAVGLAHPRKPPLQVFLIKRRSRAST